MKDLFPIFLRLEHRPVLVVGGGRIARRKIEALIRSGARVTVIAPEADAAIQRLAQSGDLTWYAEAFTAEVADAHSVPWTLVFAATDSMVLNRRIRDWARTRGAPCNAVDDPDACDFFMPAVYRDGPVTVAVGTSGRAPGLAAFLRDRIAEYLPGDLTQLAEHLARLRKELQEQFPGRDGREKRRKRLLKAVETLWRNR